MATETNFYEALQKYFKETPQEKVIEDWNKSAEFDNIGVKADDFINFCTQVKDKKNKPSFNEICPKFLIEMAKAMNVNKVQYGGKYNEFNYLKMDNINDLLDAMQRHLLELRQDNMVDKETGLSHLVHIANNCNMAYQIVNNHKKCDDIQAHVKDKVSISISDEVSNGLRIASRITNGNIEYGYYDENGAIAIPFQFYGAEDFSDGFALVNDENYLYYFIDTNGEFFYGTFRYAESFENGHAIVANEFGYCIINTKGECNVVSTEEDCYYEMSYISDSNYYLVNRYGKYGFIDALGNVLLDFKFSYVERHKDFFIVEDFGAFSALSLGLRQLPARRQTIEAVRELIDSGRIYSAT